jgi:hypothetical protein
MVPAEARLRANGVSCSAGSRESRARPHSQIPVRRGTCTSLCFARLHRVCCQQEVTSGNGVRITNH